MARLGGDEFLMVLLVPNNEALALAQAQLETEIPKQEVMDFLTFYQD